MHDDKNNAAVPAVKLASKTKKAKRTKKAKEPQCGITVTEARAIAYALREELVDVLEAERGACGPDVDCAFRRGYLYSVCCYAIERLSGRDGSETHEAVTALVEAAKKKAKDRGRPVRKDLSTDEGIFFYDAGPFKSLRAWRAWWNQ